MIGVPIPTPYFLLYKFLNKSNRMTRKETKWTSCLLRAVRLLEVCAYSYNSKIQRKVWLKHHLFVHSLLPQAHLSTYLAEASCGARCWGGRHRDDQLKSGAGCSVWTKQCSSQERGSTRKLHAMSDQGTRERCRQFAVVEELGAWGGITDELGTRGTIPTGLESNDSKLEPSTETVVLTILGKMGSFGNVHM